MICNHNLDEMLLGKYKYKTVSVTGLNVLFDYNILNLQNFWRNEKKLTCSKDNIKCEKSCQWFYACAVFFENIAVSLFWFLFSLVSLRILLLRYFSRLNLKYKKEELNITVIYVM